MKNLIEILNKAKEIGAKEAQVEDGKIFFETSRGWTDGEVLDIALSQGIYNKKGEKIQLMDTIKIDEYVIVDVDDWTTIEFKY